MVVSFVLNKDIQNKDLEIIGVFGTLTQSNVFKVCIKETSEEEDTFGYV